MVKSVINFFLFFLDFSGVHWDSPVNPRFFLKAALFIKKFEYTWILLNIVTYLKDITVSKTYFMLICREGDYGNISYISPSLP